MELILGNNFQTFFVFNNPSNSQDKRVIIYLFLKRVGNIYTASVGSFCNIYRKISTLRLQMCLNLLLTQHTLPNPLPHAGKHWEQDIKNICFNSHFLNLLPGCFIIHNLNQLCTKVYDVEITG